MYRWFFLLFEVTILCKMDNSSNWLETYVREKYPKSKGLMTLMYMEYSNGIIVGVSKEGSLS